MWVGENVRRQSPQMVSFFLRHDTAVEEHTGIEFGNAYRELLKQEIVLDSEIPSRAIVTIQNIAPELTVPFYGSSTKSKVLFGERFESG